MLTRSSSRGATCRLGAARHCPPVKLYTAPSRSRLQVVATAHSPKDFLSDCCQLGKVRFIVIGDGAILESVSEFARLKYTDIPGRGVLATVSTEDKSFECHLTLGKLKEVKLAKSKAKQGDYDLYATRFINQDNKVVLSCLLHGSQGQYSPEAVKAWTDLQQKYGESVTFTS